MFVQCVGLKIVEKGQIFEEVRSYRIFISRTLM